MATSKLVEFCLVDFLESSKLVEFCLVDFLESKDSVSMPYCHFASVGTGIF